MDGGAQGASCRREGLYPRPRRAKPQASRAALGKGRQELRVRRPKRQRDFGRPVRRQKPADRLPLHARSRLGGRLQELLAACRSLRRLGHPSGATRRRFRRGVAGAARANREIQAAHGLAFQMGVVVRQRLQFRLSRLRYCRTRRPRAIAAYNYEITEFPSDERPGTSVFYKNAAAKSSTPIRPMDAASIC